MPETKKYRIIDHDSGDSHVVSLLNPPTEEDATRIIDSYKQDKINKEKENTSLLSKSGIVQAGKDVAKSVLNPENIAATALTVAAPEFGLPVIGGLMAGQTLANGYEAYQNPNIENISKTVGTALGTALPFLGGGKVSDVEPAFMAEPRLRDIITEQRNKLNQEAINKANTNRIPMVRPKNPVVDAEFVDPMKATYKDIKVEPPAPTSQPQLKGNQLQLKEGQVFTGPGEIADTNYVRGITPKEVKGTAATKGSRGLKRTLSSHEGEHIPQVFAPEEVQSIPKDTVDITPLNNDIPEFNKENIEGINQGKVTEVKEAPKKAEIKENIDNEWLREQDSKVLKQMQPGSRGQLAKEINTVLKERGEISDEKIIEGKTPENAQADYKDFKLRNPSGEESPFSEKKKRQEEHIRQYYVKKEAAERGMPEPDFTGILEKPKVQNEIKVESPLKKVEAAKTSKEEPITEKVKEETPKIDEAFFNQYQSLLNDLHSHGSKVGHLVLRDIAAHGKSAGLDQETIVNDLIDNLHPEVTNASNKAWHATDKIFNPELE